VLEAEAGAWSVGVEPAEVAAPPEPTVLEGVWPLTGGVPAADWLAVWSAVLGVVPVAWPVAPALALLAEPVASAEGLLTCADAPPAPACAEAPPIEPEAEACWLVQVSEILLTEDTWNEPSLAWLPWTCTFCPSYCLIEDASPVILTVWPLSEVSTQLPPDCFRQPVIEFCPLVLLGVEEVVVLLVVL